MFYDICLITRCIQGVSKQQLQNNLGEMEAGTKGAVCRGARVNIGDIDEMVSTLSSLKCVAKLSILCLPIIMIIEVYFASDTQFLRSVTPAIPITVTCIVWATGTNFPTHFGRYINLKWYKIQRSLVVTQHRIITIIVNVQCNIPSYDIEYES